MLALRVARLAAVRRFIASDYSTNLFGLVDGENLHSDSLCALAASLVPAAGCGRHEALPESHPAHTHDGDATAPVLPEGELWATDEPLRAAMLKIRAGVEEMMPAYQSGTLDPGAIIERYSAGERHVHDPELQTRAGA